MSYLSRYILIGVVFSCWLVGGQRSWGASNYLRNASFEQEGSDGHHAAYWEYGYPDYLGNMNGSAARWNWRTISGTQQGTICGTWYNGEDEGNMWQEIAIEGGQHYTFGGWFWADTGGNAFSADYMGIWVGFYTNTENYAVEQAIVWIPEVGQNWEYYEVSARASDEATAAVVQVFAYGTGQNGALQFDDLFFGKTEAPAPGPACRRTPLVFSELMYHPLNPELEFVELYNTEPFSHDLSGFSLDGDIAYTFPEGTVLAPTSYLVVASSPSALETAYGISGVFGPYSESLPDSGGSVVLINELGAELMRAEYEDGAPWPVAADGAGFALVVDQASFGPADVRAWKTGAVVGGSPGRVEPLGQDVYEGVVINEVLTHTDAPLEDYLELYNSGTRTVDLAGCILTDSKTNDICVLPAGTIVAPGSFLCFDTNALGFNLSSYGETVYLKTAGGTGLIDAVQFEGLPNGVSYGRYPDGGAMWGVLESLSECTGNTALAVSDVVINEIMYHPISEDSDDEYIELHNRGASSVDVGGWRLSDAISYTIPQGTMIPAGGYLVVAKNVEQLTRNYSQLNSANTVGDFSGSLSDSSERIVLSALDDPDDPLQSWVVMDEVTYRDGGRWGEWSDGGGSSLELKDPRSDNRLAPNWGDSDESSKSSWVTNTISRRLANGQLADRASISQFQMMLLRRGECLVDEVTVIPAYGANIVPNSGFNDGSWGWDKRGNHRLSSSTSFDATEGAKSEWLRASGSGDTKGNGLVADLNQTLWSGQTVTLSAKVRWIRGGPFFHMRLLGGYLSHTIELPVPENLGTPGQQNSCYAANAGPAITDVSHDPVLPDAGEVVTIKARVDDPDGVANVWLHYCVDDESKVYTTESMMSDGAGLYSRRIAGAASGDVLSFYVTAEDAAGTQLSVSFPSDAPYRECLVPVGERAGNRAIGNYHIVTTEATMNSWSNRSPLSNHPLDCTFIANGRVIYNAGIRYRGSPFLRRVESWANDPSTAIAAYRIEFPSDDAYLDSTELNLDWQEGGGRDPTYQRERTAFWIARQVGLPVIYQRYVAVSLNGLRRGVIYTDSQHIDQDFVQSWYPDRPEGDLHKINDWVEYEANIVLTNMSNRDANLVDYTVSGERDVERYRWNWERKKCGTYDLNYGPLMTVVDAINLQSNRTTAMEAVIDMRQWAKTIAFRHVIDDWDSFGFERGKNMFAYRPNGGKWDLLLWDMDFGFGAGTGNHPYDDVFRGSPYGMPQMYDLLENDYTYRRYYWQAIDQVVNGPLADPDLETILDTTRQALESNGISPLSGHTSLKWWISERREYLRGELDEVTNLSLSVSGVVPGEADNVVRLSGQAPIQVDSITIDGAYCAVVWTSDTDWQIDYVMSNTYRTVTLRGYDRDGNFIPGMSVSQLCSAPGSGETARDSLVINEIMYHPEDEGIAFIELYNRASSAAFDLQNYRLQGVDLTFEEQVLMLPGSYAVITSDRQRYVDLYGVSNIPVASWEGSLDNAGESLRLAALDEQGGVLEIVDEVIYDNQLPWPVEADGTGVSLQLVDAEEDNSRVGNWAVDPSGRATPNAANSVVDDLPAFPDCRLNELQTVNSSTVVDSAGDYDAWIELFNEDSGSLDLSDYYLTDDYHQLDKWGFAAGEDIDGTSFMQIWMDGETSETTDTEVHAGFSLDAAAGSIALVHSNAGRLIVVDYINYQNVPRDRSYGSFADGAWTNRMYFAYPTPGTANNGTPMPALIVINEWLTDNKTVLEDPQEPGKFEDWFELYNAGSVDVDLAGYTLTDDAGDPAQWTIPSNTLLRAGAYRLVWADDDTEENLGGTNDLHANFKLSSGGEYIGLYNAEGALVDSVSFGQQQPDVSQGCFPDTRRPFYTFQTPTPYTRNLLSTNVYTITTVAGHHGSISAPGPVEVLHGFDQSFRITPDNYYVVERLRTNGIIDDSVTGQGTTMITVPFVTQDILLEATFKAVASTSGTPAWWLAEHGLTNGTWNELAAADADGDGYSATAEFIAGTQPTNSDSLFVISDIAPAAQTGRLVFDWSPSVSGRVYVIRGADAPGQEPSELATLPHPASCYTVEVDNVTGIYQVGVELE